MVRMRVQRLCVGVRCLGQVNSKAILDRLAQVSGLCLEACSNLLTRLQLGLVQSSQDTCRHIQVTSPANIKTIYYTFLV